MAVKENWTYQKMDEDGKIKHCPGNDLDGKITGHMVFGLKAWFDEHPAERIRLGWTKHIYHETKEIEYNRQTQYLSRGVRQVDEWTTEDVWYVLDKSEEQMRLEELLNHGGGYYFDDGDADVVFVGGGY